MPVFRPHPNAIDLMAYYKEVMAGRVKGNIALTIDSILASKSPNRGYMYGFDSAGKPMYRDNDTQSPVTEEGIMGEHMMRTAGIEFVAAKPILEGKHMYEDNDIDLYYPEATCAWEKRKAEANAYMFDLQRKGVFVVINEDGNPVCYPSGSCGRCISCIVKRDLMLSGVLGSTQVERRAPTIPIALGKQMRGLGMSGGLRRGEYFNHAAFTTRTPYDRPRSNVLADALTSLKNHSRIGLISLETPSFFDQIRGMRYQPSFSVYDTEVDVDGNVHHFVKEFKHPGWVTTGRAIAKHSRHEPLLTIIGGDGYVGGKPVVGIYNIRYDQHENKYYMRGGDYYSRIGQYGARGQISQYSYSPMYLKLLPSQPREQWAEEAIDSMIYQRMYGTLPKIWNPGRKEWGVLRPNGVLQGTMVYYEKMRARKRLQDANQLDTGRKKRGR